MKQNITITLQDVTEQDLRDAFHQAIDELGVKAGQQIPADMYNLREQVMDILFRPVEKPQSKPKLTEDEIEALERERCRAAFKVQRQNGNGSKIKELEAKLAETNDFLEHYIKEASDWHNAAKSHFSRTKELEKNYYDEIALSDRYLTKCQELEAHNELMKNVLEMVEDNSKMPHRHDDLQTRLYCLAERAREALLKNNQGMKDAGEK
jgi:hypothetical protein